MPIADRFYLNQYFPIKSGLNGELPFCPEFIDKYLSEDKEKIELIVTKANKRQAELVGIVGRNAFHIFDKTQE